jgi:periplasmic divalent cation tolerance protein
MEHCNEDAILSVATTLGSLDDARRLARQVLERRLAACAQIEPGINSLYWWKGELCEEVEVRLTLKTLPGQAAALEAFLAEHHPYELPQFLASPLSASAAYAQWVRTEVQAPPAG